MTPQFQSPRSSLVCVLASLFVSLLVNSAGAQQTTGAGPLRSYSTFHSLGFEWDISGDANHNATGAVRYRKRGETAWKEALALLRVDFRGGFGVGKTGQPNRADRHYNMLAGSVMFLQPGTSYEVELTLRDPDNAAPLQRIQTIATRTAPRLSPQARRLYVRPAAREGNGSPEKPFASLAAAQKNARAGDIVMLGAGDYGTATLNKSGESGRPIAYVAPPGVAATFKHLNVHADHLWIDGLTFRTGDTKGGLKANGTASDVVVRGCDFDGFSYSVTLGWEGKNTNWTVVDNTIVGSKADIGATGEEGGFSGEGVELNKSSGGHVVAYNRISRVADGVSYTRTNCDIFNNDFFDTSDDGIEMDYGYANNRAWHNRISNFHYHGLSFQPMSSGPWYFVRNQIISPRGSILKFRVQQRFVLVGNTLAAPRFAASNMHHIYGAFARNNLWIGLSETVPAWSALPQYKGKAIEQNHVIPDQFAPDWKTAVDFNGFALANPNFRFRDDKLVDFATFQARAGIEQNSKLLDRSALMGSYPAPQNPAGQPYPALIPAPASGAVDAGVAVPNLADDFAGAAPDLGAFEAGRPAPHFGPRTGYVLGQPLF